MQEQEIYDFQTLVNYKSKIIINELEGKAIEREVLARILWLAVLSQSHVFLIGDPGVAKSYLIEKVRYAVKDATYFEHLMAHNTKPEEILGVPFMTENGEIEYNIKNSVVDSIFIFLDEIYKSPAQILNSLLGVLSNTRTFHMRGETRGPVVTKLMTAFSASNEFPTGDELNALGDRFHFWYQVERIKTEANYRRYILGDYDKSNVFTQTFEVDEIKAIKELALKYVSIPPYIVNIIIDLKTSFVQKKAKASDRKIGTTINDIMKVSAFCNGRFELDISDIFLFMHAQWSNYIDREKIKKAILIYFFSNKSTFNGKIEEIDRAYNTLNGNMRSDIDEILEKRVKLDPFFINKNFNLWINSIDKEFKEANIIINSINLILQQFEQIDLFEENIRKNIFLVDLLKEEEFGVIYPYQKSYDGSMIKRCENLKHLATIEYNKCNHFLQNCRKASEYIEYSYD